MADMIDFGTMPPCVIFQPGGLTGGVLAEAFSQEGIGFVELPIESMAATLSGHSGAQLAVMVGPPVDPAHRAQLRRWVDGGGAAILLRCDQWPAAELRDWFGLERQAETVNGGHLWPIAELAIPAIASECLQVVGPRYLYTLGPDGPARRLALGSAPPTAAAGFDATRDGFADDEWFWAGQELYRYSRGRTVVGAFALPGFGPVTPTATGTGDFTGDGLRDNLVIARANAYAILRNGLWTDGGLAPDTIRHVMSWNPGSGIWPIQLFLGDGSSFVMSTDGGMTWGPRQPFAPDGKTAIPTDFGYSYEYLDDANAVRIGLNMFAGGAFYSNFGAGWINPPLLPDLGPKYLSANVIAPNLGYASDPRRSGLRDQITLLVGANIYSRDPVSGGFNYPQPFQSLYRSGPPGRHPLVVASGRAVAVLYDIEGTVLRLQQGLDHDPNLAVIAAQGLTTFSPVVNVFDDWVDYTQLDLPQADLHERLLRLLTTVLLDVPLPRLWYLPDALRSVASLSHDVEISDPGQNAQIAAATLRMSDVAATAKRKDTFFVLMTGADVETMGAEDLARVDAAGHEVTVHFDTFGSADFTAANFQAQSRLLLDRGVRRIGGSRNHGLSWVQDWLGYAIQSQPQTIYDSTFGGGPGYSHCGSVLPYRLYSLLGPGFGSFEEISHGLMDIADGKFFFSSLTPNPEQGLVLPLDDLFERARQMARRNHAEFYGCFDCLFHPVVVAGLIPPFPDFMDRFADYAQFLADLGIPSMTLVDVASWWRKRRGVRVLPKTWSRSELRFTVSASEVVDGATLVLPARFGTLSLVAVTGAGDAPLNLTPAVLDGANCSLLKLGRLDAEISLVATYR